MTCLDCQDIPILKKAVVAETNRIKFLAGRVYSRWENPNYIEGDVDVRVTVLNTLPVEATRNCNTHKRSLIQFDARSDCEDDAYKAIRLIERFFKGKSGEIGNSVCDCPIFISGVDFAGSRDLSASGNRSVIGLDLMFRHN